MTTEEARKLFAKNAGEIVTSDADMKKEGPEVSEDTNTEAIVVIRKDSKGKRYLIVHRNLVASLFSGFRLKDDADRLDPSDRLVGFQGIQGDSAIITGLVDRLQGKTSNRNPLAGLFGS